MTDDKDRRRFLTAGLAAAGLGAVPAASRARAPTVRFGLSPSQKMPGAAFSNYGQPAPQENGVIRWISANSQAPGNGVSWCPLHELDGIITPNGLHYERHHNGVPAIDPEQHALVVRGLVERPLEFTTRALLRYPRASRICFIECGGNSNAGWRRKPAQAAAGYLHGLVSSSEWTGIPARLLLDEAGVSPGARWIVAEGADAFSMTISLPLEKVRDDCLIAMFQNGERLRPEQGYPMRLLVPGWEGVLNLKWLKALHVTAEPVMARNETSRYTELGANGRARMFTFTMGPKSLITRPSAGMALDGAGFYEISGLAWSGHGRVAAVAVSADGGATWVDATLDSPILPQSFTRFRLPWQWDGGAAVLQSRVRDDSGLVQPTRRDLIAARGHAAYFHYNAVVSWAVAADGRVTHAYVDTDVLEDDLEGLFMDDDWG